MLPVILSCRGKFENVLYFALDRHFRSDRSEDDLPSHMRQSLWDVEKSVQTVNVERLPYENTHSTLNFPGSGTPEDFPKFTRVADAPFKVSNVIHNVLLSEAAAVLPC